MSSMAQGLVREIRSKYLARTPLAVSVLELIKGLNGGAPIVHDHMAFRTFGANDFGNQSLARIFMDLNYREEGALVFPNKKVNALWYSPPFCDPPLPRLFSSELRVLDLSPAAQKIVRHYTQTAGRKAWKWVSVSAVTGIFPLPLLATLQSGVPPKRLIERIYLLWCTAFVSAASHITKLQ